MEVKTAAAQEHSLQFNMRTAEGRQALAQTLFEPFKEGRDYIAIGRRLLYVHHVPQGAPAWYDKDPQFAAVKIAERGQAPIVIVRGRRFEVEPFGISVLVRVPVLEVSLRRFDILNREQVRARAEMAEQEDNEVFTTLIAGADFNGNTITAAGSLPTLDELAQSFAQLEQRDVPVGNIVMHPSVYRAFRTSFAANAAFDPVTRREIVKSGYMGDIWGSRVFISKLMPTNRVLTLGDPEFLGVISVRIDLDQMEAPSPVHLEYGWVFFEYIGQWPGPMKSKDFMRTSNHGQSPTGHETVASIPEKANALETDKRHPKKDEDTVQSICIERKIWEIGGSDNIGNPKRDLPLGTVMYHVKSELRLKPLAVRVRDRRVNTNVHALETDKDYPKQDKDTVQPMRIKKGIDKLRFVYN
jgi:hypothetical protein